MHKVLTLAIAMLAFTASAGTETVVLTPESDPVVQRTGEGQLYAVPYRSETGFVVCSIDAKFVEVYSGYHVRTNTAPDFVIERVDNGLPRAARRAFTPSRCVATEATTITVMLHKGKAEIMAWGKR